MPEGAFDFSKNEFDARRHRGFRAGLQSSILEQDQDDPQGEEVARLERMAGFADLIGEGLTGSAFDQQLVTLPNGRRARMGDIRLALNFINSDFDRYVEDAQRAGILPEDMSEADKDRLRGELSDAGAAISAAESSGSGVRREVLQDLSPEASALIGMRIDQQAAPAPPETSAPTIISPPLGL